MRYVEFGLQRPDAKSSQPFDVSGSIREIMDESDQKRKIRSMEVVSFYNDTTESHSAACEAIHVCGVVHTGEQIRNVTMELWI